MAQIKLGLISILERIFALIKLKDLLISITLSLACLSAPLLASSSSRVSRFSGSAQRAAQCNAVLPFCVGNESGGSQAIFHYSLGIFTLWFTLSVVFMAWGTLLRITLTMLEFPNLAASSNGEAPSASRDSKRFWSCNLLTWNSPWVRLRRNYLLTSILENDSVSDFPTRLWVSSICF